MTSSAACVPASVSDTPWYGSWRTRPTFARRLIIAVADAAVTPSRSARALVLTLPLRSSIQIAFR